MLVDFLDEDELQHAIATDPLVLDELLIGHGFDRVLMFPREFPLTKLRIRGEQERLDCLAIASDGTIIIIECKLGKSSDLRLLRSSPHAIITQVSRYVNAIKQENVYRFNGDLTNFAERYGSRADVHAKSLWGREFKYQLWLERIKSAVGLGKILVVLVVDEIDSTRRDKILDFAHAHGIHLDILRVNKLQETIGERPRFSGQMITNYDDVIVRTRMPALPCRVLTKYCDVGLLSKIQSRVKEVRPPKQLQVEENWWYSRNSNPEENHAVDPARTASFIPVMPDLELLEASGSPYPSSDSARTVFPYPVDYRPWLEIAREVWRMLRDRGSVQSERDGDLIISRSIARSKLLREHPKLSKFGRTAVAGALRDLSLFGIGSLLRVPSTNNRRNWELHASNISPS